MPQKRKQSLAEITSMVSVLKTSEAKARLVYDYLSESSGSVFPSELKEVAPQVVDMAFRDQHFGLGFSAAEVGGILEPTIERVKAAAGVSNRIPQTAPIPDEVYQIPGAPEKPKYPSDQDKWHISNWAQAANQALVNSVLVPKGRIEEATGVLVRLGNGIEAINLAADHLEAEKVADLCLSIGGGFGRGIESAITSKKPDLESKLKEAHIKTLMKCIVTEKPYLDFYRSWSAPSWEAVVRQAAEYGFDRERQIQLTKEGLELFTSAFMDQVIDWKRREDQLNRKRWAYVDPREVQQKSHEQWERERQEEDALKVERFRKLQNSTGLTQTLIEVLRVTPKTPELEETKKKIYSFCMDKLAMFDGFEIALGLGDYQEAFRFGRGAANSDRSTSRDEPSESIRFRLERDVLPFVGEETVQEYIGNLVFREKYDHASQIANSFKLGDWLVDYLISQNKFPHAADLSASLGNRERAKELYVRSRSPAQAREQTDSPLEKAEFTFDNASKIISERARYSSPYFTRDREIAEMRQGIEFARQTEGGTRDPKYLSSARRVIETLFVNGDVVEGVLFARAAEIPEGTLKPLIPQGAIEAAEKNQDFVSCYMISRISGDRTAARGYRALAQQQNQKIPRKLGDLVPKVMVDSETYSPIF